MYEQGNYFFVHLFNWMVLTDFHLTIFIDLTPGYTAWTLILYIYLYVATCL